MHNGIKAINILNPLQAIIAVIAAFLKIKVIVARGIFPLKVEQGQAVYMAKTIKSYFKFKITDS